VAAARVPEYAEARAGQLRIEFRYTIVKLWELDPAMLFALQRPAMLPLVALTRASDRDLERAADEIVRVPSKELAADLAGVFATLGGLRYDRNRLIDLLEKRMIKEFLTPELMRESSFLKPLIEVWEKESRERGAAEGLAKGQDEGKLAEARRSVRHILAKRFPAVAIPPSLDSLTDLDQLHEIADQALAAADEEQARTALAWLDSKPRL
jgi:predicted transposase YdaD